MNVTIVNSKPTNKIPEVGQFWKHKTDYTYLRITNFIGKKYTKKIMPLF